MRTLLSLPLLFTTAALAALQYKGVDWSSTLISEASGTSYTGLDGREKPLERIFSNNGVNTVRQRIWFEPENGDYDVAYNIELATRAKAVGMDMYLDFHYSSSWADPGQQTTPSAWAGLGLEDLAAEVQRYTTETLNAFADAAITPTIVSIGNEITAGMLWPVGAMGDGSGAHNLATLLHAASAGVKASSLSPTPKIMIHLDNGWKRETQEWWYEDILAAGPLGEEDFDVQGVSFYPFYDSGATLSALRSSLSALKQTYGKEVVVAETDFPTSCPSPEYDFPADAQNIPFSVAGQAEWVRRVAGVVEDVGGEGLFYWEPAWTSNGALGSSCESNLMVDWDGVAEKSVKVFKEI